MKKSVLCVVLAASIFVQGCCTLFTNDPQTVSVDSKPPGVKVAIGPYSGTTPYHVSLPRGKDYVVTARQGEATQTQNLTKSIEPLYWVNILIFPGLIVDLATGKMFKYEPTTYTFDFTK